MFTRGLSRGETGTGVLALAGIVVLAVACASGGGGPAMTAAEAEALLADYTGIWVLDESGSSPQTSAPQPPRESVTVVTTSRDTERVQREFEAEQRAAVVRYNTLVVLRRRPGTLELRADGVRLVYDPSPGRRTSVPVDGGSIAEPGLEGQIRVRVFRDGPGLALEYLVGSEGQVNEVLEIVNGRLRMTRTMRVFGETVAPLVLWYDRDG